MQIVVCIKQVPDTADVRIDKETHTMVREGVPTMVNPFDLYALEEGLRLRERCGGTVVAVSMGPPQAADALREAIAMGVDEAVLLSDRGLAGSDTLATSRALAAAVRKREGTDLVICGKQAVDGDTAQVGAGIAEWLGMPHVSYVGKIDEIGDGQMVVERLMDDGIDVVRCPLPALITVLKGINVPRLPSLRGKLKAKKAEVPVWGLAELGLAEDEVGLAGSPTRVVSVDSPPGRCRGEMLEGTAGEQAAALVARLKDMKVL